MKIRVLSTHIELDIRCLSSRAVGDRANSVLWKSLAKVGLVANDVTMITKGQLIIGWIDCWEVPIA